MKNTYLNIKHGALRIRISVMLTVIAGLLFSAQVWADNTYKFYSSINWGDGGHSMVAYPNNVFKYAIQKSGDGQVWFNIQENNDADANRYRKDSSVSHYGTITGFTKNNGNDPSVTNAQNSKTYLFSWNATAKSVKIEEFDFTVPAYSTIYFDARNTNWAYDAAVKFNVGHAGHVAAYSMTRVLGTEHLYMYTKEGNYDHASAWCISKGAVASNIYNYYSLGANNSTCLFESMFENNMVYPASSTKETVGGNAMYTWSERVAFDSYDVSISNGGNGTVSVRDYDGRVIKTGTRHPYLTVLKINVSPDPGYVIASVNVGGVDCTTEAMSGEFTHTITAATAVVVKYRKDPTVLIAENESVSDDQVTLNGYIEFTGCKAITEYGFVYGASEDPEVTDYKVKAGTAALGDTHYTAIFSENNGTYYYRAYIIAGGDPYYSSECRQFTVDDAVTCTGAPIDAKINGGSSASSTVGASGAVDLTSETHASAYTWTCTSYATGASSSDVHIANSDRHNTSVYVDKVGTYVFTLTATCSGGSPTATVELTACAAASSQTLLLDNHTANVLCDGEVAFATCGSQNDYLYSLYHGDERVKGLDGEDLPEKQGTGATITWGNVTGEGTFYVKARRDGSDCYTTVASAVQNYNNPRIDIVVRPSDSVTEFQRVTLTKGGTSTIDSNVIWKLPMESNAYLLYTNNNMLYEERARDGVVFKGPYGGEGGSTTYTVTATGTRTVNIVGVGYNDKKTCEGTATVDITVTPATPCP